MKTIEITITPQGESIVQTKGFVGSACKDASRFIEQALGEKVSDKPTAEFFQTEANQQRVGQR